MAAPRTTSLDLERSEVKSKGQETLTIERILACAVAVNWTDLTRPEEATSIQVEYRTKTSRSLESLKFWASTTRGVWKLVCDYRMDPTSAQGSGTTFNTGHFSADLPWMLDAIMRHQADFAPSPSKFLDGLIQVGRPSESELTAALKDMSETMDQIGPLPVGRQSEQ